MKLATAIRRPLAALLSAALLALGLLTYPATSMSAHMRAEALFSGRQLVLAKAIEDKDIATFKGQARQDDVVRMGDKGMTLLWFAMQPESPNFEAVTAIIAMGVNPDTQLVQGIGSALDFALMNPDTRFLQAMLDGGLRPNHSYPQRDDLMVRAAGADGSLAHVKLLVERGANLNVQSPNGETPLHNAVSTRKIDVALFLVEHGANVNSSLSNGVSVAWSVYNALKRQSTGPQHEGLERLRELMIQRGAKFPPDPPATVREQRRAASAPGS